MKRFDQQPSIEGRALQMWIILVGLAMSRKTITYGELADLVGFKGAGVMSQFLDPIMNLCQQNDLPPLTVLVGDKDSGLPREGLTTSSNYEVDRESVFTTDWYAIVPPSLDELALARKKSRQV